MKNSIMVYVLVDYVDSIIFYYCGYNISDKPAMSTNINDAAMFITEKAARHCKVYNMLRKLKIEEHILDTESI